MKRSTFQYASCYCEENIYKLLEKLLLLREKHNRTSAAAAAAVTSASSSSPGPTSATSSSDVSFSSPDVSGLSPTEPHHLDAHVACFISSYHSGSSAVEPRDGGDDDDLTKGAAHHNLNRELILNETVNQWSSLVPICTEDPQQYGSSRSSHSFLSTTTTANKDPFVFWDYHVIAMVRDSRNKEWYVIDFDTHILPSSLLSSSSSTVAGGGDTQPQSSSSSGHPLPAPQDWLPLIPLEEYFTKSFYPLRIWEACLQATSATSLAPSSRGGLTSVFFPSARMRFSPQEMERRFTASKKGAAVGFRVIPADVYLTRFRSMRSHMKLVVSVRMTAAKTKQKRKSGDEAKVEEKGDEDRTQWQSPPPTYAAITEPSPFARLAAPLSSRSGQEGAPPSNNNNNNEAVHESTNVASSPSGLPDSPDEVKRSNDQLVCWINLDNRWIGGTVLCRDEVLTHLRNWS